MSSLRNVILCADDYGLSDGVSRGIAELAAMGRLSATGAMTNMPGWRRASPDLEPLRRRIGIGLHLNLTTGAPLGPMAGLAPAGRFPSLLELLAKAFRGGLDGAEIMGEIARQLDAFEEAQGAAPSFVDGHQHVHVLPGVREALLRVLRGRGLAGRVWLRDPADRTISIVRRPVGRGKALVVRTFARGFAREAHAAGFVTNRGFSGFAPFDLSVPAHRIFEAALSRMDRVPLVMCHPGYGDDELRGLDPAVESRVAELEYLKSDGFGALLEERGIRLVPGVALPGAAKPEFS
ncbi:ChbG/HpnK family deacetylase [Microvirga makkahensis]|uniref:ChbG/HpnK family deacetylase n=1 Tax=Microvirga makkahensis TaxID=1128670 RepID=A0A7X3MX03_9HYPH|nr:ChbG/HpnK family deacetylase [Microvirga makkahensis]MXQ14500.1 ChbG/HpnK family deacetylase [Microvirga makkahensis]